MSYLKILPEGQYICTICRAKIMKVKSADLKNDNTEIDITINQRGKNSVKLKTLTKKNRVENFTRNSQTLVLCSPNLCGIPEEIIENFILPKLSATDICNVALTCKELCLITKKDSIWKSLTLRLKRSSDGQL